MRPWTLSQGSELRQGSRVALPSKESDRMRFQTFLCGILLSLTLLNQDCQSFLGAEEQKPSSRPLIRIQPYPDTKLEILVDDHQLATYVYRDAQISRPYFANVRFPGGPQLTRNHPPRADDLMDHADFHPGLWLAFGDVNQHDYWRLKAKIEHLALKILPSADDESPSFEVRSRYLSTDAKSTVCIEVSRFSFAVRNSDVIMDWSSTIMAEDNDLVFGDQEEMGLGLRVASVLNVKSEPGGHILNADGLRDEAAVWGKQSLWCDYSGVVQGKFSGIMLIPHPDNRRPTWWHARDYGLLVANSFGAKSTTSRQVPSNLMVKKGDSLLLKYRIVLHCTPHEKDFNPDQVYREYLNVTRKGSGKDGT